MNIYAVAYIFSIAIATLTIERAMRVFFNKRDTHLVVVVLSYVFLGFTFLIHINDIVEVFLNLLALALISLNYKSVAVKRVAAVAVGHYLLLSLTDINMLLSHSLPSDWLVSNDVLAIISSSLFIYLIALLVFPLFKHIKKTTINLNKLWLPLIVFPIMHTFVMLFRNLHGETTTIILVMFNISGAILIFLFLYNNLSKVVEDTLKSALHTQEKEYYFSQCRLMQESMEKVKSIRHDIKNHLAMLTNYTAGNKAATDYLNSLINNIENSEVYSDTGNIALDSIINFKLKNAKADNIELDLNVAVPPEINVEVTDIVTVVGNLLDNALEAVAKTTNKMIKLDIEFVKGGLFAKVENSFNGEICYITDNNEDGKRIASLKGDEEHGYGLKNIQQSIEKYNGHMKISYTESIFSTIVFLYISDKAQSQTT